MVIKHVDHSSASGQSFPSILLIWWLPYMKRWCCDLYVKEEVWVRGITKSCVRIFYTDRIASVLVTAPCSRESSRSRFWEEWWLWTYEYLDTFYQLDVKTTHKRWGRQQCDLNEKEETDRTSANNKRRAALIGQVYWRWRSSHVHPQPRHFAGKKVIGQGGCNIH